MPDGYTYLDRFLDEMKEQNNGEILFVATTIGDYEIMAEDMQELRRYINQLGEVIIYYRNVTMPNGEKGVGVGVKRMQRPKQTRGYRPLSVRKTDLFSTPFYTMRFNADYEEIVRDVRRFSKYSCRKIR